MRIALATCRAIPDLDPDDRSLAAAFHTRGIEAHPVVWDDPGVEWTSFAAVVVRSVWDYARKRDAFTDWARSLVIPVYNDSEVLLWNTDKRYLAVLDRVGLPVIATRWIESVDSLERTEFGTLFSGATECVLKPCISAGAKDTLRFDTQNLTAITAHAQRILGSGRAVMVQPYLKAIESKGETALIYFRGVFSHAIRKGALLSEPGKAPDGDLFAHEVIEARVPSAGERTAGDAVLAALPFDRSKLLYARIDLVPGDDGSPEILEVELTEPSLFFSSAPGSEERFVEAWLTLNRGVSQSG